MLSNIDPNERRIYFSKYTEDYKNICFQVWYSNNRPSASKLVEMIPEDENHRKPNEKYMREEWFPIWNQEADMLDIEVKRKVDIDLVAQRADMLKKQAEAGKTLQQMGMDYLVEHGFDKASDALRALVEGVRIERESRGLGEALDRIFKMDDEALRKELVHLLQRDAGVVVEGEFMEDEDANSDNESPD